MTRKEYIGKSNGNGHARKKETPKQRWLGYVRDDIREKSHVEEQVRA